MTLYQIILKKKENLDEIKQVIMSKRIKIYKEMKTLVDLEKNLAENLDDTCLKNIIVSNQRKS